jgi:CBS domain-containing protein
MNISDCMKRNVISISETATVREAAAILAKKHIGLLPIVSSEMNVIGVVGLKDLLSLQLPDFVRFVADVDFVHDFGAVETSSPSAEMLDVSITTLMKDAINVEESCGLTRAYALMLQHNLHDMPVVSAEGKLIGVASRVDIGTAILAGWAKVE